MTGLPDSAMAQAVRAPDFSKFYDQIYQVRVSSARAGSKSSIGSGFQVSADGLIVTNYHVVSDFVQSPEQYRVQFRSQAGKIGDLELLNFDVVNDLALLRLEDAPSNYFELASNASLGHSNPEDKGQLVYAIGNPRDFGVTLVQGFNNGLVAHSYNDQLLFSGSLNPGMSGGPALDTQGRVFGVNVATAGSQLSFLVPVAKLRSLLEQNRVLKQEEYQAEIAAQVKAWQRPRLQALIDSEWQSEAFVKRDLFGEIRNDFQCWGDSNEDDVNRQGDWVTKSCRAANEIFLSGRLNLGQILFSFEEQRPVKLNALQFTGGLSSSMGSDNRSNFDNATNYQCHVDFVKGAPKQSYRRVSTCVRAHKKLQGLFDSLLLVEEVGSHSSYTAHLSVSGAEQDQLQALNSKFIERAL